MFYFSLFVALFFTMTYINLTIADICNAKAHVGMVDENIIKQAKQSALMRWVSILIMTIFWPMVFIF